MFGWIVALLPPSHLIFFENLVAFFHTIISRLTTSDILHLASTFGALIFRTKSPEISIEAYKKQKNINMLTQFIMEKGPSILRLEPSVQTRLENAKKDPGYMEQVISKVKNFVAGGEVPLRTRAASISDLGAMFPGRAKKPTVPLLHVVWRPVSDMKAKVPCEV